ncbi:hypothetical protein Areg01_82020 [Actinoplanes regularis]|nr:hypothetical protein Areg01_82020 [Actinoplanes regularis]
MAEHALPGDSFVRMEWVATDGTGAAAGVTGAAPDGTAAGGTGAAARDRAAGGSEATVGYTAVGGSETTVRYPAVGGSEATAGYNAVRELATRLPVGAAGASPVASDSRWAFNE